MRFFIPTGRKLKVFAILSGILFFPYLLVIALDNPIDLGLPILNLLLAFLGGILIGYMIFFWLPLIPLYSLNVEVAFTRCDFFGSCPSRLGFLWLVVFWLVVLYVISCIYDQLRATRTAIKLSEARDRYSLPVGMYLLAIFFAFQTFSMITKILLPGSPDIHSFILLTGFITRVYRSVVLLILIALLYGIFRKRSYTVVLGIGFMLYRIVEKTTGITTEYRHLFPSWEFVDTVTIILPLIFLYTIIIFYFYKNRKLFAKADG